MKYHAIGQRIQTARRNARMTQEELAATYYQSTGSIVSTLYFFI